MKILQEWKDNPQKEMPRMIEANSKVDLTELSDIINRINEAVAPELSKDVYDAKNELDIMADEAKKELMKVQKLNSDYAKLKAERNMIVKKSKVVELLSNIYTTYQVNEKTAKEMMAVMNDLDTYDEKRLDRQIQKLQNITESK